jgi:hypothetical protein
MSSKTFGKPSSGAKNSRMGTLKKFFENVSRKPWSSIYSTEMFYKKDLRKW